MCAWLSGCASLDDLPPRPGVQEARACQKNLNQAVPNSPDYLIRACTNTGVWIVEHIDPSTQISFEYYDFVNHEYSGPDTQGQVMNFAALSPDRVQSFIFLQKSLNSDLLVPPKEKQRGKGLMNVLGL